MYVYRDPSRVSVARLAELQKPETVAGKVVREACGTVEGYWMHRDNKEPVDIRCSRVWSAYKKTLKRRAAVTCRYNLLRLEEERGMIAARTRLHQTIQAKQSTGEILYTLRPPRVDPYATGDIEALTAEAFGYDPKHRTTA